MRLLENDAKWLYEWADEWILKDATTVLAKGTPVIVSGSYAFNAKLAWLELTTNSKKNTFLQKN